MTDEQRREKKRQYNREYFQRNRERMRDHSNRYYDRHREEVIERQAQYRAQPDNRIKERERKRAYQAANREKINDYKRAWRARRRERLGLLSESSPRKAENDRIAQRRRLHRINAVVPTDRNGARWTAAEDAIALQPGLSNVERACILYRSIHAVINRRYGLLNPDGLHQARENNREYMREYHQVRYANKRESILAKGRERYSRDREKIAERRRELRAEKRQAVSA